MRLSDPKQCGFHPKRQVDLLTTTEAMDEMWSALRALTHLSLPVERLHEPPKPFGYKPRAMASLMADPMTLMTERLAPCDWRLYRLAQERTKRILDEWKRSGQRM